MSKIEKSKEELSEELHHYQLILDNLHEGYILVNEDEVIKDVNPAYCEMIGYSKKELLSMNLGDIRISQSYKLPRSLIREVAHKGGIEFEARHRTKDGQVIDVGVSAAIVKIGNEKLVAELIRDITDHRKEQQRLEKTRQRFKSLFEYNPHAVYYFDLNGHYQGLNEQMEKDLGYSENEILGVHFSKLIAEEDQDKTRENFDKAAKGEVCEYEVMKVDINGNKKPIRITNFPMIIEDKIQGVFGISEDLSEKKLNEKKLRESEERWHRLVEDNPQSVLLTVDSEIVYINKAGTEMLGADKPEKIIGRSKYDFVHPDYEDIVDSHVNNSEIGEKTEASEQKILDINGGVKDVLIHSVRVKYKGDDAVQSVFHDITERKKREQIIEASLEEKRVMLQEIHHRVKNNMAVVSGLLELQAMKSENEEMREILEESQLRIHSMAMIHEKLYASKELSKISFDDYIKELSKTVINSAHVTNKNIVVFYELDEIELNITQAIPCGLILNELIVNAFKHAFNHEDEGDIVIGLSGHDGLMKLWVEDNGDGLPGDFDIDKQESLGMTLINTLTKQIEGDLVIKAGNTSGTCFQVTFNIED